MKNYLLALLALTLVACGGKKEATGDADAPANEAENARSKLGVFMNEYPAVKQGPAAGTKAFAPWQKWVDEARTEKRSSFIFYLQEVKETGEYFSVIKNGSKMDTIPNSLLVPVSGGEVKKGDILITKWQTGTGMKRAIVTEDGNEPKIAYLENSDMLLKKDDKLKPDTYRILKDEWETGQAFAVKDGSNYRRGILISMSGDKALMSGFAGKLKAFDKKDCTPLPMRPDVKVGDEVQVLVIGTFKPATVKSVNADKGRIEAEYKFAGKMQTKTFCYGTIAPQLP